MRSNVLYVSRGLFHPHLLARRACRGIVEQILGFAPDTAPALKPDLSLYRAVVLYFHEKSLSPEVLEGLRAFVAAGGGLVALHSAAASCKRQPGYADLLGGRFAAHGPVERFSVQPTPGYALPSPAQPPFAILDERYRHEITAQVVVDYESISSGAPEPFAWRRTGGGGRVFYLAAGHTLAAWSHPAIHAILRAGLLWALKEQS